MSLWAILQYPTLDFFHWNETKNFISACDEVQVAFVSKFAAAQDLKFRNKENVNFATLSPEVPLINATAFILFEKLVQI